MRTNIFYCLARDSLTCLMINIVSICMSVLIYNHGGDENSDDSDPDQ